MVVDAGYMVWQGEHSAAMSSDVRRLKRTQAHRSPLPQQREGQAASLKPRKLFRADGKPCNDRA